MMSSYLYFIIALVMAAVVFLWFVKWDSNYEKTLYCTSND